MQLDEMLALIGPDGVAALGEDITVQSLNNAPVGARAVVSFSKGQKGTGACGAAIIAKPELHIGDILTIREGRHAVVSVQTYSEDTFRYEFGQCKE